MLGVRRPGGGLDSNFRTDHVEDIVYPYVMSWVVRVLYGVDHHDCPKVRVDEHPPTFYCGWVWGAGGTPHDDSNSGDRNVDPVPICDAGVVPSFVPSFPVEWWTG